MLKHITILLPSLVSVFWLALFLLNRKRNSHTQNIWTLALVCIAVSMGVMAFFWNHNGNYSLYYKLDILDNLATLSFMPFIFRYFREVTGDRRRWTNLKNILLFLPPILLGGLSLVVYLIMGEEQATAYARRVAENPDSLWLNGSVYDRILFVANEYLYSLFIGIQGVWVLVYAFRGVLGFRHRLNDFFSDTDDKDIEHHQAAVWGLLALLLLTFITAITGYLQYVTYDNRIAVITASIGIILFYICYHISLSHYTAESFDRELTRNAQPAYDFDGEPENKTNSYRKFIPLLQKVIEEDRLFLQKQLHLDELAGRVGTNRKYISRILKEEYHCSFWEFINRHRIAYAKKQALNNPTLTVDELSDQCGFSQTSAFCRTFRQYEGMPFKEWMQKQKNRV
ncbi:AraC family transcriptional regulator [Parabacteroides sp. PF5-6]|uniref:helix-turn-helix domain-containing protein n=1 Tax=Parabacteroides sp. PF5-6 TaxID=1742403 RepID=UPI002404DF4B|nr:AraC family transcriptional regulator [Parabacteroides sp. PF5-6]MDF9831367.1 AraC-like DNA-binding protein/succinate dehydrogenase/fumarate reductase cytochrome b subunit [Parabacteroides sp. PF5-6]